MSLASQIPRLPSHKIKELHDTLVEVGIALETDGRPREIFRRVRNQQPKGSLIYRVYDRFCRADVKDMRVAINSLMEMLYE